MADLPNNKISEGITNNEDIINELTKDLESSLLTSDTADRSSSSSKSDVSENFVIDPDGRGNTPDNSQHPDFNLKNTKSSNLDDFENQNEEKSSHESDEEDYEVTLKDLETSLTESEKLDRKSEAERFKNEGNEKFKLANFEESIELYTMGLKICPLAYNKDRAILYSNRAASKMKLNKNKAAIQDCTKAIENDESYIKAYYRRAQCNEQTDLLDECLADYKKILELDSQHLEARKAIVRLPPLIEERNERMKTEMLSKLKDLGNLVLRPFGLSTDNFKLNQDPETKGYSINFQQNK
ncbi:tetratricopeptide repeat protein 1-like [Arctopsyche grandis]|uniref:tetratricopeptide repeat protein 1-like n=1 Tax=Arctopsyche grandis TaxID=121162 RepID=UPI00406D766C